VVGVAITILAGLHMAVFFHASYPTEDVLHSMYSFEVARKCMRSEKTEGILPSSKRRIDERGKKNAIFFIFLDSY
jgi:hypothetical protein